MEIIGLAGSVAKGVGSAAGTAKDGLMAVGEAVGDTLEDGHGLALDGLDGVGDALGGVGDMAGDTMDGFGSKISEAFSKKRTMKMDISHHVYVLPEWLIYAFSASGIIGFIAKYGRTICCCYWPLAWCGGCFARCWNNFFRKFACPCANEFIYLTLTINRIIVHQTVRAIGGVGKAAPRNLEVGMEFGQIGRFGGFSTWKTVEAGKQEQPLELPPQLLGGGMVYFETRRLDLPETGTIFKRVDQRHNEGGKNTGGPLWISSQVFRTSFNSSKQSNVPSGWSLQEIRAWRDNKWDPEYSSLGEGGESAGDPNTILANIKGEKEVTRLEFAGKQEGAAEWPAHVSTGLNSRPREAAMTFTHWGSEEDLVLVLHVLLEKRAVAEASALQRQEGAPKSVWQGAVQSVAENTGQALRQSALWRTMFSENPEKDYEMVRCCIVEIRPDDLEEGPISRSFRGARNLLHVHAETAATRSLGATVVHLRRCRVEVAPGRGPLKGKVKVSCFIVPRKALLQPTHPRRLDPDSETSRIDIFHGASEERNLSLTIPLRPGDTEARLVLRPKASFSERLSAGVGHVPLAGGTLSRVVNWATGAGQHDDELFAGEMRITVRPHHDGSSVSCEVDGQNPVVASATDLLPGTTTQSLEVPASSSQEARCSYELEFRMQSSTSLPESAQMGIFPTRIHRKTLYGWCLFLLGVVFIGLAITMVVLNINLEISDDLIEELEHSSEWAFDQVNQTNTAGVHINRVNKATQGFVHWITHQKAHTVGAGMASVGGGLLLLSCSLCTKGHMLPKVISNFLAPLVQLVTGLVMCFMVIAFGIFLCDAPRVVKKDQTGKTAIFFAIAVEVVLCFLFGFTFWEWLNGVWTDIVSPSHDTISRDVASGFALKVPQPIAEELHFSRPSRDMELGFGLIGSPKAQARQLKKFATRFAQPPKSIPILLRRPGSMAWEDGSGRYFLSETLHIAGAVPPRFITLEDLRNSVRELRHRGLQLQSGMYATQKLFRELCKGEGSKKRPTWWTPRDGYSSGCQQQNWSEERLTRDGFIQAWDNTEGDQAPEMTAFRKALQERDQACNATTVWELLHVNGVVPTLVSSWKRHTFADEEHLGDSWQALQLEVALDGDDNVLCSSYLHAKIRLRHLGRDMGYLQGISPCFQETGVLGRTARSRCIFKNLDSQQRAGPRFDEYSISFDLKPDLQIYEAGEWDYLRQWKGNFAKNLKKMRVGWELRIIPPPGSETQERRLESLVDHPMRDDFLALAEEMHMFHWYWSELEATDIAPDDAPSERDPLTHMDVWDLGMGTQSAKPTWWPISEYRRILDLLCKSYERSPQHGMIAVDILPLLQSFQKDHAASLDHTVKDADVGPKVVIKTTVSKMVKRPNNSEALEFARLFNRQMGWKAKVLLDDKHINGETGRKVAAGWTLEKMENVIRYSGDRETATPVQPWLARDGGDPVAWLGKFGEHQNTEIELLGLRRVVLDVHGQVHELSDSSAQVLVREHDEDLDVQQGMSRMELDHMLRELHVKQDAAANKSSGPSRRAMLELSVPLHTKADVGLLQRAVGKCQHATFGTTFSGCDVIMELSTDAAVPCSGVDFIKVVDSPPIAAEHTNLDEFAELVNKKAGTKLLPAVATVHIHRDRLLQVPHERNQMISHLMVLAKVHGFDPSKADAREALWIIAGQQRDLEKEHKALKCLALGDPWPLHLKCAEGHKMSYYTPHIRHHFRQDLCCSHCKKHARRSYSCSECDLILCEFCASSVEELKNVIRYYHKLINDEEAGQEDDDDFVKYGSMTPTKTKEADLKIWITGACTDSGFHMSAEEINKYLSCTPGELEELLEKFMPVQGTSPCNCGCVLPMKRYKWRTGKLTRTCKVCQKAVKWNVAQYGCSKCDCVFCEECGAKPLAILDDDARSDWRVDLESRTPSPSSGGAVSAAAPAGAAGGASAATSAATAKAAPAPKVGKGSSSSAVATAGGGAKVGARASDQGAGVGPLLPPRAAG